MLGWASKETTEINILMEEEGNQLRTGNGGPFPEEVLSKRISGTVGVREQKVVGTEPQAQEGAYARVSCAGGNL